jgi:FtsP/CotA-like multicopper oxidase with cupredoxin domain
VTGERRRLLLAGLATLAVVLPIGWFWYQSLVPSTYSVMSMGYLDYGGGPTGEGEHHGAMATSVADLVPDPARRADVTVELKARKGTVHLASGRTVDGYTLNGVSPGPRIEVTQGQLLEVHLQNVDVPEGITVHWHGVEVPNAEDGVAGVTQDAVVEGHEHTYRFVAKDVGTYWYHSHQVAHEQVVGGLLGALVVLPRHPDPDVVDATALVHTYEGDATVEGKDQLVVPARPGQRARIRVINTDNGPTKAWADAAYRVVAVDGHDVVGPTDIRGKAVTVTAGGRVDLLVTAPEDGSAMRIQVGSGTSVVVGDGTAAEPEAPPGTLDLLSYGRPAPLGFDPSKATRTFTYDIGRRPGFVDGRPGLWWTVNGHLFPDIPMYVVREGDVVRMRIENHSGDVHPMHLHGHHAVVLARDGVKATGSPWWIDSLDVKDGETFDIAFVADNPGIWMDHCHNLNHAAQGLLAHLMYEGVTEPYRVGGDTENEPE